MGINLLSVASEELLATGVDEQDFARTWDSESQPQAVASDGGSPEVEGSLTSRSERLDGALVNIHLVFAAHGVLGQETLLNCPPKVYRKTLCHFSLDPVQF
jgi:hypothetical protein